MKIKFPVCLLLAFACIISISAEEKTAAKPLKALLFVGGGYHDYEKLAPHLTNRIGQLVPIQFDVKTNLEALKNKNFADGHDVVVYDICYDEIDSALMENSLNATRAGKPAVMIHCAVHAFRNSKQIGDWESFCGMRSKVHDPFQSFEVEKLDPKHPVTKDFPDGWKTPGDELYQTIEFLPGSKPLLKVKSPLDGREHIVCWVHTFGKGRVFATTLGHDMQTATSPDYIRLLANGILWACDRSRGN